MIEIFCFGFRQFLHIQHQVCPERNFVFCRRRNFADFIFGNNGSFYFNGESRIGLADFGTYTDAVTSRKFNLISIKHYHFKRFSLSDRVNFLIFVQTHFLAENILFIGCRSDAYFRLKNPSGISVSFRFFLCVHQKNRNKPITVRAVTANSQTQINFTVITRINGQFFCGNFLEFDTRKIFIYLFTFPDIFRIAGFC